ncbi:HTH DNA-binding protein [Clostridium bornimense]|uniref:HTH DNA-binding protein n=1 Tax=Clostridium bornimense TaxID=1216932 RepID=W6RT08_9CLOT|nr:AIM24 family protein [Clostridium bornimense]CDM67751.1 HTH DNA-binding protein [Clostridium bornimense]
MRSNFSLENSFSIIDAMVNDSRFEILEYPMLNGGNSLESAIAFKYMKDSNIKLRQVRILLNDSAVKLESGSLSFLKGDIDIASKIGGVLGIGKKFISSKLNKESMIKPVYTGSGAIYLEPSFNHYLLLELDDEEIIVEPGMFYCCENSVNVSTAILNSVSSSLFSNEQIFQTKLSGSGIVVLESPVPANEIMKFRLCDDFLKIDGNFSFLRTEDVELTVEKSTKTFIGSAASGEGLLNVFSGTGEVWLMPTKSVYDDLEKEGHKLMITPSKSYGKDVENTTDDE